MSGRSDDSNRGLRRDLRDRAQARARMRAHSPDLAQHDVYTLVEELRVQQFELEIQNEELRTTQDELAASRDRYRELYDAAPVGYLTLDGERIAELNRAACAILGDTREHLVDARFTDFVAPESIDALRGHSDALQRSTATEVTELALHNLRGDRWHVRLEGRATGGERAPRNHCALVDISARKRVERELERANAELEQRVADRTAELQCSEAHLRTILDTTPEAIVTVAGDGRVRHANPAAERMFGIGQAELANQSFSVLLPEPYAGEYEHWFQQHATFGAEGAGEQAGDDTAAELSHTITRREITANRAGEAFPVEVSVAHSSHAPLFVVALRDLTESKRLEHEVLNAAEQERGRISRELHDSVSQQLAGLAMSARTLTRQLEREGSAAADSANLGHQLQQAARGLRDVVHDLAPLELEHGDHGQALTELAADTDRADGLSCACSGCLERAVLDTGGAIQLLRIAREAVHNAIKHAQPTHIDIVLEAIENGWRLSVRDDGSGPATDHATAEETAAEGLGLRIMRYRAHLIGAVLEIEPRPTGGTAVTCTLAR